MLRLNSVSPGRIAGNASAERYAAHRSRQSPFSHPLLRSILRLPVWMLNGYRQVNAGDLAAAVAFYGIVALVPTFLLLVFVAGLFFHRDQALITALYTSSWGLPPSASPEAFQAALSAREYSGWFGALSLLGFAWIGTGFVSCLARSMNRIYGAPDCGYICEKQRGFFVVVLFAALFLLALISSTVPTLFVAQDLPVYFQRWALARGVFQVLSYGVAITASVVLFLVLYWIVPNAGQALPDIWPGTLVAAVLFVGMAQAFPIYIRMVGGVNRFGVAFGLVSLLVAWFYVLAHVLLFGTFINAAHQRRLNRQSTESGNTAAPVSAN